jgi:hypothetical protein
MIARERTVREGRSGHRQHRPGAAADPIAAIGGGGRDAASMPGVSARVMAPKTQRTIVVGSASTVTVTNREITKHRL